MCVCVCVWGGGGGVTIDAPVVAQAMVVDVRSGGRYMYYAF